MNRHQLGKSALLVSEVAFGCMSLQSNDEENARIIHRALEHGINYFDTADLYDKGNNEITVGKALKEKRKEVIIATKVGNQWRADGSGWDWNPRKEYILQSVEGSLRRLQTEYIDLYQLHGGTIQDPFDGVIEAFEMLQQQGKIRYYGISSIRPNVIRKYVEGSNIVSVMMQYSLLDRRPEEEMLDFLLQHKIAVLSRGALAKGLLVNKPADAFLNYNAQDVRKAAEAINKLSGKERNAAQTALQFVLHHPAITSAVVGIRTEQQLQEVAGMAAALKPEELQMLQQCITPNFYTEHR
jgi:aryl-alcohol dehydrogenase-like predicted oxidoreductase